MFRKLVCTRLSTDFAKCTEVVSFSEAPALRAFEVLIAPRYLGVNASDINYTSGRYKPNVKPPFIVGFEGVGTVLAVGSRVKNVSPGDRVATFSYGTFGTVFTAPANLVAKLPESKNPSSPINGPESVQLIISGLTALLALRKVGELPPTPDPSRRTPTRVLITAAAGATGTMAVQIAKASGAFVIGTTSTPKKVDVIRAAGADVVVVTTQRRLKEAISTDVPGGAVDIVYEGVGGELFCDAFDSLAHRGRLVVIGSMSGYKDGSCFDGSDGTAALTGWPMKLLGKSASVRGFFLSHFVTSGAILQSAIDELVSLVESGKLTLVADIEPTVGLEGVAKGVARLQSGATVGKVVVQLPELPREAAEAAAKAASRPAATL